jgi:hypothetical protein
MSNVYAQATKTVYKDQDGDGYGDPTKPKSTNNPSQDYVSNNLDKNDKDASIYPGALEIKDGKDNDQDGLIDEVVYYQDLDGDGYGSSVTKEATSQPTGYTFRDGDADDNDANVYPNATDICDGKDNDGNGVIDDGGTRLTYYADTDGDTFGDPNVTILSCTEVKGYVTNKNDFDDRDATRYPNAPELCDGKDNDNDGSGDPLEAWYVDNDGDTYGAGPATMSCAVPSTTKQWVRNNEDADDTSNKVYPGAIEICDGKDNNQDGNVDEGLNTLYYVDSDGDGYGNPNEELAAEACTKPDGYVENSDDRNDNDNTIYPGAPEICDGKDNNQAGGADEGLTFTLYALDNDGDGFGGTERASVCDPSMLPAVTAPAKWVLKGGDNVDNDNTIYPGATELCDNKDNDQDGTVDEGFTKQTYYQDTDGDGWGNPNNTISACEQPEGYVARSGDCNDGLASINPGSPEICGNNLDENCNGMFNEVIKWRDFDGDGWGGVQLSGQCNFNFGSGYVDKGGDCNDTDRTVYPGAADPAKNCGVTATPAARMDASAESNQLRFPVSSLYPNPATSELTIDLSRPASELKYVRVSSVIDQTVLNNGYTVVEGNKILMRVSHLKPSVYVIRIDFGDGYEMLRFIKN